VALAGGKYIAEIGNCLSFNKKNVGPAYSDGFGHRCMGRGGHPDLLAWDVAAILGKLLS